MTAPQPAYGQISEAQLAQMTPEQIARAHEAGQTTWLLTGENPAPVPAAGQLGDEHLAQMSPEQIAQAFDEGRLSGVLTGQQPAPAAPPAGPVYPPPTPEQIAAWTASAPWLAPPANPQG